MNTTFHLALLGLATLVTVSGSARPTFVGESLEPNGLARVSAVVAGETADLVVLDGGLEAGFRTGMIAQVERGTDRVARLLVVEATPSQAVALILEGAPGLRIQTHDRVLRSVLSL